MAENNSINGTEQHKHINKNVREDGTLISNENRDHFVSRNNKQNENSSCKKMSSKSFFRIDPTYGPRSYDKSNKTIPLSQNQKQQPHVLNEEVTQQETVCIKCKRTFKTPRGLQQHQRSLRRETN